MSNEIHILRLCLTTPSVLTPVVVGPPGIGKSAKVKSLAKSLKLPLEVLSPGERGEGAFGVVPVPNGDGYLHYPPPDWVKQFADKGRGIIFVDEINTAPPALQPALLGLILDGRIGGYQLPVGVRRVAAMNPTSQAAAGWDLPPALANRMQYLQWVAPSASEWTDWLLSEAESPYSEDESGQGWAKARALAAAYHRKNPGRLMEDPDKVLAGRDNPAFCSPRSWETAVRMLAAVIDQTGEIESFYPSIAEGILGKPNALEWCTWLRKNDLPDPEKLLADPTSWKPDKTESDKVFATCFAVSEAACLTVDYQGKKYDEAKRLHRWQSCWRVLGRAMPLGKGMVAIAARKLARPEFKPADGLNDADVRRIVSALQPVFQAAGEM